MLQFECLNNIFELVNRKWLELNLCYWLDLDPCWSTTFHSVHLGTWCLILSIFFLYYYFLVWTSLDCGLLSMMLLCLGYVVGNEQPGKCSSFSDVWYYTCEFNSVLTDVLVSPTYCMPHVPPVMREMQFSLFKGMFRGVYRLLLFCSFLQSLGSVVDLFYSLVVLVNSVPIGLSGFCSFWRQRLFGYSCLLPLVG